MDEPEAGPTPAPSLLVRRPGTVIAIAIAVIAVVVAGLVWRDRQAAIGAWRARLESAASDRRERIEAWLAEREADVLVVAGYPSVTAQLLEVAAGGNLPPERRVHLRNILDLTRTHDRAVGVAIVGRNGVIAEAVGRAAEVQEQIPAALAAGDRYAEIRSPAGGWWLIVHAPVRDPGGGAVPIGIVAMLVDPEQHLWPLILREPLPTDSGETLLVRQDGAGVAYLSPLRHAPAAVPTVGSGTPAALAARGERGSGVFRDYRGVEVLAAAEHIGRTGWGLVQKVDRDEALAMTRVHGWGAVGIGTFLVLVFAGIVRGAARRERYRSLAAELARTQAIAAEHERYALLSEHTSDIVLFLDARGRILEANRAAERAYGFTRAELMERTIADLQAPGSAGLIGWMADDEPGGPVFESRHRRRDGREFAVELSAVARVMQGERRMAVIVRDVSERERVREALRSSAERFEALITCSPLPVIQLDLQGKVRLWNPAAERQFGWSADEVVGQYYPLVSPEQRSEFETRLANQAATGETLVDVPVRRHRADGSEIELSLNAAPLRDREGHVTGVVAVLADVTELRRLNATLEERVRERTEALAGANAELEAFNYSVSHDLRAPLRHIVGFVHILQEDYLDALPEDAQRHLSRIEAATVRMDALIGALLTLSRIGRAEVQMGSVDLGALVREAIEELRGAIGSRPVEFNIGALPVVDGDPVLLSRAFVNLIDNAIKFTRGREPARIEIGVHEEDETGVVCFVRDNGAGFDPEYAQRLFGVFQRLHSYDEFEGTGVGLCTVKRIIEKHGGRVWADSRPNEGATFYVRMPMLRREQAKVA